MAGTDPIAAGETALAEPPQTPQDNGGGQELAQGPAAVTGEAPIGDVLDDVSASLDPERKAEIDGWVAENVDAEEGRFAEWIRGKEQVGGDRVGAALQGQSSLGALTEAESDYLAEAAVEAWTASGSAELDDVVRHLGDHQGAESSVARAYGWASREAEYGSRESLDLIREGIALDPAATIEGWSGDTESLGIIAQELGTEDRRALLQAVADGSVTGEDAADLTNAMFVGLRKGDAEKLSTEFAGALAATVEAPPGGEIDRDAMRAQLEGLLDTEGGRDLLLNRDVAPPLRIWALGMVQADERFTTEALADGWGSGVVATAQAELAAPSFEKLHGLALGGDRNFNALTNTVGTTLGEPPDTGVPEHETQAELEARLDQGLDRQYYSEDSQAHRVTTAIHEKMGAGDTVSAIPVTVTADEFGVYRTSLFRIDHQDGRTTFVDNTGRGYSSVEDWRSSNELPPGTMVVPEGLEPGADLAAPEATHAVVDTTWERFLQVGDAAATGLGIAAGALAIGALVVGTGGTAGVILAAGAVGAGAASGGWMASRGVGELIDDHKHGESAWDLTDPQTRANWFDVVAGGLSVAAIGPAIQGLRGATTTANVARGFAAVELTSTVVDGLAAGDRAIQLGLNWEQMTPQQRTAGMLEIAVFAGLGTANVAASGGFRNAFNFNRMARQFETGTPFRMETNPDLAPGTAVARFDLDANGRPTNVRLEVNGEVPLDVIQRHSWAASRVEEAGGLRDRLSRLFGGDQPPVGSTAWAAEIEIGKIQQEAADISRAMARGDLSPAERQALEVRAEELDNALAFETQRLGDWEGRATGVIADPHRGAQQAGDLKWPDAPAGYTWVASQDGVPHLRSLKGGPKLEYDPVANRFNEARAGGARTATQAEFGWTPTGDATRNAAFTEIEAFRAAEAEAGTPITGKNGGYGTVSAVAGPDGTVLGVNSSNLSRDDLALAQQWRDRLEIEPGSGHDQFLFHAEAHSLMQLHQRTGGQMPSELTLYVDRATCPFCRSGLPAMMEEMGIDRLTFEFHDGTRAQLSDGKWQVLD